MKKIGICHYRIGKTDGVSLEIAKRKKELENIGYSVKLISGSRQEGADYIISDLEFDRTDILKIKHNAFGKLTDYKNAKDLLRDIYNVARRIEHKFYNIHRTEKFDYLYLHNIFSHGRHISAAKAFYDIHKKTEIKYIAVDHDFHWFYGDMYKTNLPEIKEYLAKYVPPDDSSIKHIVINSISKKVLKDKIGISAMIFPDTFDFKQKPWIRDKYNSTLLKDLGVKENDLIILQATRIVERKAIEISFEIVNKLNRLKKQLEGKTLYNGKKITENSEIILLLAGYVEPASQKYWEKLLVLSKKLKIKTIFIGDIIEARREKSSSKKIYSLWDVYVYTDLVTYPSIWEGWGNQFIEAVYAKRPVVVFEYPVFKKDIKKEGYFVISLGDKTEGYQENGLIRIPDSVINRAAKKIVTVITSKETNKLLQNNFRIGCKYHDEKRLESLLNESLDF